MNPTIDMKATGIRLKRIMKMHGFSVKDVQQYLGLGSVQSVYHWLNGSSLPTIDNLYALSELFQLPVDELLCGNRKFIESDKKFLQRRHLHAYYDRLSERKVA